MSGNSPSTLGKSGATYIGGFSIPIRHLKQHHQNACWATCLAMIFQWKGVDGTPQTIFAQGPGIISSYTFGEVATIAEANKVAVKLSNGKISFRYATVGELCEPLDKAPWLQCINIFEPILFTYENHCRILMGYNGEGQMVVLDPGQDSETQPQVFPNISFRNKVNDVWVFKGGLGDAEKK